MTAIEVLHAIRERLADPKRWCQRSWARDINGDSCGIFSPEARSWCITGAAFMEGPPNVEQDVFTRLREAAHRLGSDSHLISYYNDTHTHAEVLAVIDNAIEHDLVQEGLR